MPGDPSRPDPDPTPSDAAEAREYLAAVLRAARSDAVEAGADPDAVTVELEERLRRVRRLLAADRNEPAPGEA